MTKQHRRKCKVCRGWFHPARDGQIVCSFKCAAVNGKAVNDLARAEAQCKAKRKQLNEEKEGRKQLRERRLAVKPLSYFARQAQTAFNAFIRARDAGEPCISCGRFHDGQYHAGHYRTVGSHPELRFNEDNCWSQCSVCNNYLSGNIIGYQPNLIARIGQSRFDSLMGPHELPKWKRDDYILIRDSYRVKLKELKREVAS